MLLLLLILLNISSFLIIRIDGIALLKMVHIEKAHLLTTYIVVIGSRNVLKNASLWDSLFLKVFFNGLLNATKVSLNLKDPMKIGYLTFFVDLAGYISWLYKESMLSHLWRLKTWYGWHLLISLTLWQGRRVVLPRRSTSSVILIGKSVLITTNVSYTGNVKKGILFCDEGLSSIRLIQVHWIRDWST